MKRFIQKFIDIYNHKELRGKILFTLGMILIYRIGSFIVLPGVNSAKVAERMQSIGTDGVDFTDLLSLFTGGAFSQASIFALGIMPYISASIIMQLMGIAVPAVQKMQKEGESGRKKITQYTRFLTIAITLVQAPGYLSSIVVPSRAVADPSAFWYISAVIILSACTLLIMWLGEKITDKGIGNGISLLIMIGIIVTFPQSLVAEYGQNPFMWFLFEMALFIIVIMASVALVQAVRKVTVQMAKMNVGGGYLPQGDSQRSYVPLKVNSSGVMPIIFAQAIMVVPMLLSNVEAFQGNEFLKSMTNFFGLGYNIVFFIMVVGFTYLYTAITVNTNQIADDLKRQGSFVPGVKPGKPTADLLDNILSKITLWGSIFLGLIAVLPAIVYQTGLGLVVNQQFSYFFGGTSLLIMVGVVLDTLQQIDSYLLSKHYDGLMKSGKLRGRNVSAVSGITG